MHPSYACPMGHHDCYDHHEPDIVSSCPSYHAHHEPDIVSSIHVLSDLIRQGVAMVRVASRDTVRDMHGLGRGAATVRAMTGARFRLKASDTPSTLTAPLLPRGGHLVVQGRRPPPSPQSVRCTHEDYSGAGAEAVRGVGVGMDMSIGWELGYGRQSSSALCIDWQFPIRVRVRVRVRFRVRVRVESGLGSGLGLRLVSGLRLRLRLGLGLQLRSRLRLTLTFRCCIVTLGYGQGRASSALQVA